MAYEPERIVTIGELEKRGKTVRFGIKEKDRSRHIYVIGQTGTGKSTLLEMLAMQDIRNGTGLIFMDPHGQSVEALLQYVTREHLDKIIYFAPHHQERPIGLNIMEDIGYDKRHLVVSSLMASFEKIWGAGTWSDRMAYILQNTLLALIEYPGTTLLDVGRMYSSKDFREKVVANLKDPQVRKYWVEEFANYTERYAQEATPSIQNKLGQFTSNPLMRNIIGQKKSAFNFREIMDEGKILLVNLSKGQIGESNARMLGVLFTTKIYLAALSRSNMTKAELEVANPCNFFVDEFQSFANSSFSDILSEARKYKLNLVMAHQYLGQLYTDDTGGGDAIRDAVFGNVGTFISFRVGPVDAEIISKQFAPNIMEEDLVALQRYHIYLTLNIDGAGSTPFSARTFYEPASEDESLEDEVIQRTMDTYGVDRASIEKIVSDNLAEDAQASEAAKKGGGQKGGGQQGWGKKSGNNAQGGQKQQGQRGGNSSDQKNNETHTPLKGLVKQVIQQQVKQEKERPERQHIEQKGATKTAEAETEKTAPTKDAIKSPKLDSDHDENRDTNQKPSERQKKSLFGKLFSQDGVEQEGVQKSEVDQSTEVLEVETDKPVEKKESSIIATEEQQQEKKAQKQEEKRPPKTQEKKRYEHKYEQRERNENLKPMSPKKWEGIKSQKNTTTTQRQQNSTRRESDNQKKQALRNDAQKQNNTTNGQQKQRSENTERKRGNVIRGNNQQKSRQRSNDKRNIRQQNIIRKPAIQMEREKSDKHTQQEKTNKAEQERDTQRNTQQQKRENMQPVSTVRRPSGIIAGTVSRSAVSQQPEVSHTSSQQETSKQQKDDQQEQARQKSGNGLGDLVKSAKVSGLRKDLKVAPKKEKQAPPVSQEEGWVAIGDLTKG